MSEFQIKVVRIGRVEKHENADTLSFTMVHGGYPVIFRSGEFAEGDLAVYVPVEAVVPLLDPRWSFLKDPIIVAKRLRGKFSMGILTAADPSWVEGQDVQEALGITRIEEALHPGGGLTEKCPHLFPIYTDIESLRRWPNALVEGEEVVLREKLHGENSKFMWKEGRLWVGSRTQVKRDTPDSQWWRAARAAGLEEKLARVPGLVVYGECHGYTGGFPYGVKPGVAGFRAFDAFNTAQGGYLNHREFADSMDALDIPLAPRLHKGPWSKDHMRLAEGQSSLDERHVREGFVVRPVVERQDPVFGRLIMKMIGQGYLLNKREK